MFIIQREKISQLLGLSTYTVVWFVLFVTYKSHLGDLPFPYGWFYLASVLGYIFVVVFHQYLSGNRLQKTLFVVLFVVFGFVILQTLDLLKLIGYGDQGQIGEMLRIGIVFPRWLGGTVTMLRLYAFWKSIPALASYASNAHYVTTFVKVSGSLAMMLASIVILKKYSNRLSAVLPLISPIYLMLSMGYDEYYPFVAGLFLVFLLVAAEKQPVGQNVYLLGMLLAVLPVFYFPFLVISSIVLAYLCFFYPSTRPGLLLTFLFVYLFFVFLFWPSEEGNYLGKLLQTTNIGNNHIYFTRYLDQSANNSIYFKPQCVVTWEHFDDLFYMLLWSGSIVVGIILTIGVWYLTKIRGVWKRFVASPRAHILTMIFLWQLYYFIFMIPRLGAKTDIDLFFSFYICISFIAGYIWDFIKKQTQLDSRIDDVVIPAIVANAIVTLFFLLAAGIPDIV